MILVVELCSDESLGVVLVVQGGIGGIDFAPAEGMHAAHGNGAVGPIVTTGGERAGGAVGDGQGGTGIVDTGVEAQAAAGFGFKGHDSFLPQKIMGRTMMSGVRGILE